MKICVLGPQKSWDHLHPIALITDHFRVCSLPQWCTIPLAQFCHCLAWRISLSLSLASLQASPQSGLWKL